MRTGYFNAQYVFTIDEEHLLVEYMQRAAKLYCGLGTMEIRRLAYDYAMGGQHPARGPDPAHEGQASGPPPCSAITLQSGPRNPSHCEAAGHTKMHCIIH